MSKKLYLPKPLKESSEWGYYLQRDNGHWESFHKVGKKLTKCTDNCPYCGKYPKMERCRIEATLIGTAVTRPVTFASKQVISALKDAYRRRGTLKGITVTLRGTGGAYELVSLKEPVPERQLDMF